VNKVQEDADGVTVVADRRGLHRFDLVVGADGHQSVVRPHIDPESRPSYAGYLLWRGSYSTDRLTDKPPRVMDHGAVVTVVFPGGHAMFSLIPDLRGRERINWGIYCTIPGLELGEPGPMPPGSIGSDLRKGLDRLLDAHFPPYWAEVVRSTPRHELCIQPIYDATVSAYVSRRMLLIGDAGTITRPHTAAGATKALHEALSLERICSESGGWPDALAAYDAQRCASASALVELGRSLGGAQVEHTPQWSSMSQLDFEDWMRATVAEHAVHYRV
jgi:2-polyprenyl-6-methoxyphenol hydroxylase-like FAD-dependent oxidoreductase